MRLFKHLLNGRSLLLNRIWEMEAVYVLELFIAAFIVTVVPNPLLKRVKFGFR